MKLAVHLHITHLEHLDELLGVLGNITGPYDLYVTSPLPYNSIFSKVLRFNIDADIDILDNRGLDIGAFIHVLGKIELADYDYVVKLHTRKDAPKDAFVNGFRLKGPRWRRYLASFCSSRRDFKASLKTLAENPHIGMVADGRLIVREREKGRGVIGMDADRLARDIALPLKDRVFVAGSMFMARASLMRMLKDKLNYIDFPVMVQKGNQTVVGMYERLLGYAVCAQGSVIDDFRMRNCRRYLWLPQLLRSLFRACVPRKAGRNRSPA